MKFCPYCGADLLESNVLFCAHCGKKLPPHEAGLTEPLTEDMRPASQVVNSGRTATLARRFSHGVTGF